MENDEISGFKITETDQTQNEIVGFRQILENVSPERIDMLVAEISEIRDRMAENAKLLVDQTTFRGEVQGSIRIIQWMAGAAVVVGMALGGAMATAIMTLNELKNRMGDMPSPVELKMMMKDVSDLHDWKNSFQNAPLNPTNQPVGRHH